MTANVVRVNGDYKIQTNQGGTITLDTGSSTGNVNIIGDLTVTGAMSTFNTTNLTIEDNTIILNKGETGNGVSLLTSGLVIDRGTNSRGNASIIWDESQSWDDPVSGSTQYGLFIFNTAIGGLNGIRTNSIDTNGGKLYINTGSNVVSVHGAVNYETNVVNDNDIPNKKYVDAKISYAIAQVGGAIQQFPPNPNIPGFLLNDGVGNLSWLYPTATTVGLGNVTNESKTTMFTNAALTGTPTAPTATSTTNTTQIATTAFVQDQVITLLDSVPDAGKTLGKLYTLIGTNTTNIATKAPIASPTFTGTVSGITAAMVGLGDVTNESKTTMFSSPIFTGTVSGVTAAMVGLGNVTNESKETMFTSPTFTGTVTGVTAAMVGLGNVTNESKTTMFISPTFTGHPTIEGVTSTGATGTGNLVFATSPSLTTPTLGVASATSINKLTITTPATGATLTIADGKTLTASNSITFTATDNSSVAFGAGGTVTYTSNNLGAFASTTSAQLASVLSDETGTGSVVFSSNPVFSTSIDSGAIFTAFASSTSLTEGYTGTAASTHNIATGATASTNVKTINIGTGGASGSTTNITIGSSTGTTNTTIYGLTFASPSISTSIVTPSTSFNLINTTATTVNAFGAATAITVGNATAATLTVNPGTVVGANTTQNLFNTVATTVSAFGAATTISIGATTGTLTINNPTLVGSAVTQNVFNTTATTVNAFGAATAINIGATTGTLTINNPALVGSQTTQNVFNTVATTVNAFGAATAVTIGATTGTLTINNPTLVGSQTTQNVFNTVATTVNEYGAATSVNSGYTGTLPSTYNISTGAVISGNTKIINIGTGGASGSTTNITIGSSTGTTNTTINGNLIFNGTLSGSISRGTSITTTAVTSITFTGIPSGVKQITVMFNGVSTNGASGLNVQLGSGSLTSTGYSNGSARFGASTFAAINSTTGFLINSVGANVTLYGNMVITNLTGNTWTASFSLGAASSGGGNYVFTGGGAITLSGILDRVALLTANGADLFVAGATVNILYQG